MSGLDVRIRGGKGTDSTVSEAHVHPFKTVTGTHHGLVALTQRLVETEPVTRFFTNSTFGIAMNQNVTFGSIASVIHSGGTTSAADSGTADDDVTNHIKEAAQNFDTTCVVGMYATSSGGNGHITSILAADLTCDDDVCPAGNEAYTIDPVWTGTAVQGTWSFADAGKITLTSGNDNDRADIDAAATAAYDWDNFTALTGKIDLDTYAEATTTIVVSFNLNGALVGNSVNLDDFIDTGDFTEQSFAIPKASLGLSTQTVNGLTIIVTRTAGAKPTFKLDDLQLEASGTPATFAVNVESGEKFHISELVFAYKDNINSISTVAGAAENVTNMALDPDAILGVSALTNGFVITRSKKGKTLFSATVKTLGAHIAAGAKPDGTLTAPDGSSTFQILRAIFPEPLILTGNPDDTLEITINDNMSGLERFTVAARGGLETL